MEGPSEQLIVGAFLILLGLEFAIEFGLNEINLKYVRAHLSRGAIPEFFRGKMSEDEYRKSFHYTLAKGRFQRWGEIYGRLVLLGVLFSGFLGDVDRQTASLAADWAPATYAHGLLFCVAVGMTLSVLALPLDLYSTFGIESRFGFNKTTPGLFIADKAKALLVTLVLGAPFLWVVLWLMDVSGPHWWLWAFAFITAFQWLMVIIYPTLIAPLFNRFEPLEPGELRDRILALAERLGFETRGIYSMDGSRRSAHSNAYFTGIGRAKRIVLFDTLIEQMTVDQGLAVLAHEMGHYKMKHVRRILILQSLLLFVGLYALSWMVGYEPFFRAFGLERPSPHGALVLFALLSGPATFYLAPLLNHLSRKHEYEADCFAARTLGDGKPMEQALIRLSVKNLSNLTPHPWYSAYYYSHPTVSERIRAIRACLA